jgi:hypothetical protein
MDGHAFWVDELMQEHRWQARRAGPLSAWESFQNLNAGSLDEYFEACLNSTILNHV